MSLYAYVYIYIYVYIISYIYIYIDRYIYIYIYRERERCLYFGVVLAVACLLSLYVCAVLVVSPWGSANANGRVQCGKDQLCVCRGLPDV